jgi:hypothetical protein
MDGHISPDNPFKGKSSPPKHHEHGEGFNSLRIIDDGGYDMSYGDGGIAKNLLKHQNNNPNDHETIIHRKYLNSFQYLTLIKIKIMLRMDPTKIMVRHE